MQKGRKKKDYVYAIGRRKNASARARLFKGKGENKVNDLSSAEYFPGPVAKVLWSRPFELTETAQKYFATVKVRGGGKESQLEASVQAVSKALAKADKEAFRLTLKKAGLLSRDARIRERRKVGTGGKARRAKQSPKR